MTAAPQAPYGQNPGAAEPRARPGGGSWAPQPGWSGSGGGPAGPGRWAPPNHGHRHGQTSTAQRGSAPLSGVIQGQVRGIDRRTDPRGRKRQDMVWTFRIERYDDIGNQVAVVPVEMRGRAFVGAVTEGDWVRAHGLGHGGNLRTRRIENLTTGSLVKAKRHWTGLKALVIVTLLVVVALGAYQAVASAIANAADDSGDETPIEPIPMP